MGLQNRIILICLISIQRRQLCRQNSSDFNSVIITYMCKNIENFSHTVRQLIVLKIQLHAHKDNHAPGVCTSVSELFLGPQEIQTPLNSQKTMSNSAKQIQPSIYFKATKLSLIAK